MSTSGTTVIYTTPAGKYARVYTKRLHTNIASTGFRFGTVEYLNGSIGTLTTTPFLLELVMYAGEAITLLPSGTTEFYYSMVIIEYAIP